MRALVILCLLAGTARAEPWYRGEHANNRFLHLSITAVGLSVYPFTGHLEDVECNWCGGPNSIDSGVRDALRLSEDGRNAAATASNISAYLMSPAASFGLVLFGTLDTPSSDLFIDDMLPIVETMVITQWVTRVIKFSVARRRPYAHFTSERDPGEDNVSFISGHTSFAFALATSAGHIAHVRGYKIEPYVWATGITFGVTTAYLRIAADRHYFTDTVAGALVGVTAGLTVPLLMRRNIEVAPTRNGIAIAGAW